MTDPTNLYPSDTDTICAISTPPGRGGIAVIRISGQNAFDITDKLHNSTHTLADAKTHTAHLINISDSDGNPLDQCVATIFKAPNTFTGQDTVELSVHGSTYIQHTLINSLLAKGARIAGPGEFTRRAFLNRRIDLAEAEAVADIIASSSKAAHRLAIAQLKGQFSKQIDNLRQQLIDLAVLLELELDFSEEDVTFADRSKLRTLANDINTKLTGLARTFSAGQAIRDGVPVAIIGRPNAGKSSLLNTLLNTDRAIVSDIPGTTRDTIEDTTDINGITFRFIDTAGLRHTDDPIEQLGIQRAYDTAARATIIIRLLDPDQPADTPLPQELIQTGATTITCLSKSDLRTDHNCDEAQLPISTITGQGIDTLRQKLTDIATQGLPGDESLIITNARHHAAILSATEELNNLIDGLDNGLTTDLLAEHLRAAIHHLAAITGDITTDTLLHTIFLTFCIGK